MNARGFPNRRLTKGRVRMPTPFQRAGNARPASAAASRGSQLLLALATLMIACRAQAAEISVLTAGAFKPALLELARTFEAESHTSMAISNDTAGGITARIVRGEEADLVILPTAVLDSLAAQGKVVADTVTPVAKSGIGVVMKAGTPPPDISSVEAFKQAMLATPSFAYIDPASGGSSGVYLAKLFDRLGIAAAIKSKAVLVPGGLVASRVDDGEAELGLQQISELREVRGLTFVGPLPAEIQNYTVYAAAIPTAARRPKAGRALLTFLKSEAASRALAARGLEQP
jgi:molybdate transport system substrate-binding protein